MSEIKQPSIHDVQTLLTQLSNALYVWIPYLPDEHLDEANASAGQHQDMTTALFDFDIVQRDVRYDKDEELIRLRATLKQRDIEMATLQKQLEILENALIPRRKL